MPSRSRHHRRQHDEWSEIDPAIAQARYGDFEYTDAIRHAPDCTFTPREGYRVESCEYAGHAPIPALISAVTRSKLFSVFQECLGTFREEVDVILETSHGREDHRHTDLVRHGIDLPVAISTFLDYEDLLVNDGNTGVAVAMESPLAEIQFDEHKLLIIYARRRTLLRRFEDILQSNGIAHDPTIAFITERCHLHSTTPRYEQQFLELAQRMGASRI